MSYLQGGMQACNKGGGVSQLQEGVYLLTCVHMHLLETVILSASMCDESGRGCIVVTGCVRGGATSYLQGAIILERLHKMQNILEGGGCKNGH